MHAPKVRLAELPARIYYLVAGSYYVYKWFLLLGPAVAGLSILSAPLLPLWLVLGLSASGGASLLVGTALSVRLARRRFHLLNPALDLTRAVCTYEVCSSNQYRYTLELTVRARTEGIEHYRTKFHWTGTGTPTYAASGSFTVDVRKDHTPWTKLDIRFPHQLRRGEETSFFLHWDMIDETGTAFPHLSKVIDDYYPYGVTLRVLLPSDMRQMRFETTVFPTSRTDMPIRPPRLGSCDPHTGEFSWVIATPRFGFRYFVRWFS